MDNPFERYDLDPREGIAAITRRLKELAEDAKDEAERARIREAWEELTLHPQRRLRAALFAHPETRSPLGAAPPLKRRRGAQAPPEPTLATITPGPSLALALGETLGAKADGGDDLLRPPPLHDDPLLPSP